MLQKLDKPHMRRLEVADYISKLGAEFDMRDPCRCICGHALRLYGQLHPNWHEQLHAGAELLGLTIDQANALFVPSDRANAEDYYTTGKAAARVLNYLAVTDLVDWTEAGDSNGSMFLLRDDSAWVSDLTEDMLELV